MTVLYIISTFAVLLLFAWIPLVIYGIVRLRRRKDSSAALITVFSILWGAASIIVIGLICIFSFIIYSVHKEMNIESFDPVKYKGDTGTVKLNWENSATATLYSSSRQEKYQVKTVNGQFVLPVGKWNLKFLDLKAEDKNKNIWHAYIYTRKNSPLLVKHNQTVPLRAGPPFTAVVGSSRRGNTFSFSFVLSDCNGNRTNIRGNPSPPPSFQLIAPDGKVLMEKRFKYG